MSGKVRLRDLEKVEKQQVRAELLKALDCIHRSRDFTLFIDLLTETEQLMLCRRIHIAKHLIAGKNIDDICQECRCGKPTIASVNRWLESRFNTYREVFPSLYATAYENKRIRRRSEPIVPLTFRWVRRKYPLHYLLFNMLLDDIDFGQDRAPPAYPYRPLRWRRGL